jgi:hypothetical protein
MTSSAISTAGGLREEEDASTEDEEAWQRPIRTPVTAAALADEAASLILQRGVPCATGRQRPRCIRAIHNTLASRSASLIWDRPPDVFGNPHACAVPSNPLRTSQRAPAAARARGSVVVLRSAAGRRRGRSPKEPHRRRTGEPMDARRRHRRSLPSELSRSQRSGDRGQKGATHTLRRRSSRGHPAASSHGGGPHRRR